MTTYRDDFTYYWLDLDGQLQSAAKPSLVPDEYFNNCCQVTEAIRYVQKLGCTGKSQHTVNTEYHRCALEVLKLAVQKYGEEFETVLRGVRDNRPDTDHKILFGTTNPEVARFYGEIRKYKNIRGLLTYSISLSVTDDEYSCDEEIIFFPQ